MLDVIEILMKAEQKCDRWGGNLNKNSFKVLETFFFYFLEITRKPLKKLRETVTWKTSWKLNISISQKFEIPIRFTLNLPEVVFEYEKEGKICQNSFYFIRCDIDIMGQHINCLTNSEYTVNEIRVYILLSCIYIRQWGLIFFNNFYIFRTINMKLHKNISAGKLLSLLSDKFKMGLSLSITHIIIKLKFACRIVSMSLVLMS